MVCQKLMQDRLNFWKPDVFPDIHVPLLVFEANILKKIHKDYRITKTECTVLAAGHLIEKGTAMREFSNPKLTSVISGISRNVVFECLQRLMKHELIMVKRSQNNSRKFKLTEKGKPVLIHMCRLLA